MTVNNAKHYNFGARVASQLRILTLAGLGVTLSVLLTLRSTAQVQVPFEAPAGFDGLTNGFESQEQFDSDREVFERRMTIADGLGPVYNAQSCAECHQNPVTGAISQITNLRAGHFNGTSFVDHPGGSLINDRATNPSIQERVLAGNEIRSFRMALSLLGS